MSRKPTHILALVTFAALLLAGCGYQQNNAEVERIAREQYGFIYPGEHPYVVVPPSTTSPPAPTTSAPATTSPAPKR